IKADVERALRNPGHLLVELASEGGDSVDEARAWVEQERESLQRGLDDIELQRDRLLDLYQSGSVAREKLDKRLSELQQQEDGINERLRELRDEEPEDAPQVDGDMLERLRERLDEGLSPEEWREVIGLLVSVRIETETLESGRKRAKCLIEYKVPNTNCVVAEGTGTGSLRLRAASPNAVRDQPITPETSVIAPARLNHAPRCWSVLPNADPDKRRSGRPVWQSASAETLVTQRAWAGLSATPPLTPSLNNLFLAHRLRRRFLRSAFGNISSHRSLASDGSSSTSFTTGISGSGSRPARSSSFVMAMSAASDTRSCHGVFGVLRVFIAK
ncbi:MAG: hypothetical protein ACOC5K_05200, partial [Chloroflexota bacterium]